MEPERGTAAYTVPFRLVDAHGGEEPIIEKLWEALACDSLDYAGQDVRGGVVICMQRSLGLGKRHA